MGHFSVQPSNSGYTSGHDPMFRFSINFRVFGQQKAYEISKAASF